jgi:hypothetical protein
VQTSKLTSPAERPKTLREARLQLEALQQRVYGSRTVSGGDQVPLPTRPAAPSSEPTLPNTTPTPSLDPDLPPAKMKMMLANLSTRALKTLLGVETARSRKDKREDLIASLYRELKSR